MTWDRKLREEIIGPVEVAREALEAAEREQERERLWAEAQASGKAGIFDSTFEGAMYVAEAHDKSILAAVLMDIRERLIRIEARIGKDLS